MRSHCKQQSVGKLTVSTFKWSNKITVEKWENVTTLIWMPTCAKSERPHLWMSHPNISAKGGTQNHGTVRGKSSINQSTSIIIQRILHTLEGQLAF